MLERDMESLIAEYPSDFFPRNELTLEGRQRSFRGVGRFDLLFRDPFGFSVLMELKAVPARYEDASQLARYRDAMLALGDSKILMWLVAPSIPASVREFLDHVGIEHTEIHIAEFKKVATLRGYELVQADEPLHGDLFNNIGQGIQHPGAKKMQRRPGTNTHTRASSRQDPRLVSLGESAGTARGESNEQLQRAKVLSIFKDYIHRPFDATMQKYMVKETMKKDRIIQWSYISKRLMGLPLFDKDRIGATFALKWIVQSLVADGTITELSANQLTSRYQYTGKAYLLGDLNKIG